MFKMSIGAGYLTSEGAKKSYGKTKKRVKTASGSDNIIPGAK